MAEKRKGKPNKAKQAKQANKKVVRRPQKQAVASPAKKTSKPAKRKNETEFEFDEGDDLPPENVSAIDADSVADEVERAEAKGREDNSDDSVPAPLPAGTAVADGSDGGGDDDPGEVLPSMEGMSILRETEINDVINDVKRRSEANGGFVT